MVNERIAMGLEYKKRCMRVDKIVVLQLFFTLSPSIE